MKNYIFYIVLVVAAITAYSSVRGDISKTRAFRRFSKEKTVGRTYTVPRVGRKEYKTMQLLSEDPDIVEVLNDYETTEKIKVKAKNPGITGLHFFGKTGEGIEDDARKVIRVKK